MKLKILCSSFTVLLLAGHALAADSKKEARVTQVIRDVKILPSDAAARSAAVNDKVSEDTGVRTGGDSRSELTFTDLTITRLGSNTIFSFNRAGRNVQLDSGSILLRVPKDSGGGAIKTSAVTVAVTGTTVIFEGTRAGRSKLIVLEGGARLSLVKYSGQSRSVRAGQMLDVPAGATTLPMPTNVDLNKIMNSHPLITDFPPLPSRGLIAAASQQQPPPSGPSVYPILPVIDLFGGGISTRPRGPRPNPPGQPPQRQPQPQPQPRPQPPPAPGTTTGEEPGRGPNKGPSTPPPASTNQSPGKTKTPPPPPVINRTQTNPKPPTTPRQPVKKKTTQPNSSGLR